MRISDWSSDVCSSDLLKTIDFISKSTEGQAEVVFNYLSSPAAAARTKGLGKRLEPRGSREPFRSYFEPGEVRSGAASCGFGVVEDIGPGAMVMRYCAGRADPLHPRPSFRIAHLCKRRSEEHTSELQS